MPFNGFWDNRLNVKTNKNQKDKTNVKGPAYRGAVSVVQVVDGSVAVGDKISSLYTVGRCRFTPSIHS